MHSVAGADEVTAVRIRRKVEIEGTAFCTSPGPFGATLPKGEGMNDAFME